MSPVIQGISFEGPDASLGLQIELYLKAWLDIAFLSEMAAETPARTWKHSMSSSEPFGRR